MIPVVIQAPFMARDSPTDLLPKMAIFLCLTEGAIVVKVFRVLIATTESRDRQGSSCRSKCWFLK